MLSAKNLKKFNLENSTKYNEQGQVLLLVVLLVTVVLTVAMSMLSRSIVNVRMSVEEDQSLKALAAAEAGIEKSLTIDATASGNLSNNATFNTSYSNLTGSNFLLNNGRLIVKDEGADIWLSDYSDDPNQIFQNPWQGTLSIYWGSNTGNCNATANLNTRAALEVLLLTGSKNNPTASRFAYDPCAARRGTNSFSNPITGTFNISGQTFRFRANINVNNPGILLRVTPLYANAYIAVAAAPPGNNLPVQGTVITSTGVSGETKRTVSVLKENPFIPNEFFTYSFFWPK